jgi:hypothetical protein
MRIVGLLVLVWLIVGAIAAGQRGNDRADRGRRTTQLRGCQP